MTDPRSDDLRRVVERVEWEMRERKYVTSPMRLRAWADELKAALDAENKCPSKCRYVNDCGLCLTCGRLP